MATLANYRPRILVIDQIAQDGINLLSEHADVEVRTGLKPSQLVEIVGDYDALIVRSGNRITDKVIEAAGRLKVIGRAGVGVDNIDLPAATRRGIVVLNAPAGTTIAAAEHTIALMLALARRIPQAHVSLRSGKWNRNEFIGVELRHKTLGIIGLGKIGSAVARRASGLEMRIIAHDPFVPVGHAHSMGIEMIPLEELLKQADFVTLHTPLTSHTKAMIGEQELGQMKDTAYLINCARGGLVEEEALYKAVEGGAIAGAAVDVFSKEPPVDNPLFKSDKIITTPHLGAMTTEAQVSVALDIAEQVIAVLKGQQAMYAVNLPMILPEALTTLSPFMKVAEALGQLATQLADDPLVSIEIKYSGEISQHDSSPLKAALIKGLLAPISEEQVTLVNAGIVARSRGLNIIEQKEDTCENYNSLITLKVNTSRGSISLSGTMMRSETHIVAVNGYWVDVIPTEGYLLLGEHLDRPGIIGTVGTLLGTADVNISFMQVGRHQPRGRAVMILGLDEPINEELRQRLLSIPDIYSAKVVKL